MQGAWVQPLVGDLRFHTSATWYGKKRKTDTGFKDLSVLKVCDCKILRSHLLRPSLKLHNTQKLGITDCMHLSFLCFLVPMWAGRLWNIYLLGQETSQLNQLGSVQSLSYVQLFVTPWTAAHQASLSITNSRSLLKLRSIELVMPSNHLILCHPLLPTSVFPSIRIFPNESVLHIRWPQYWSFSFSISPSNEYSGLISFS